MRRPRVLMATMLASVAIFATVASSSTTGGVSDSHARPRARSEPFFDFIRDIAFDPHDSKTIWAVLDADSALYRTDDGAHSWRRVSVLPPRQLIGVIGLDHSGHHLWVGAKIRSASLAFGRRRSDLAPCCRVADTHRPDWHAPASSRRGFRARRRSEEPAQGLCRCAKRCSANGRLGAQLAPR